MSAPFPQSTYRLQLHAGFTFGDARALLDYLDELGVSDVYVSPILRAEKGSTHGYNVCAYDEIAPELGGEEGFRALSDELHRRGMRILVDFVPNHMGIASGENAAWNDVLENGRASRFADFFDIDWEPSRVGLRDRVLYPILGAQYGDALEGGELVLARREGSFVIRYFEHELPVSPESLQPLLDLARDELGGDLDAAVARYNGRKGEPASFDRLDALLCAQRYRLSYWRVASDEINYRRFFDVNMLAAVRMELPAVFDAAHAKVLALIAEGRIDGLRLDHTDGLRDPAEYFATLRRAIGPKPVHVVAEKILEHGERLPRAWEIDGTTGYDATSVLAGVWIDASAEAAFTALYRRITGDTRAFDEHVRQGKRDVIDGSFGPEMNMLARALERIAEGSRRSRDFTFATLREAIMKVIAAFPVYRTYVRADGARGPNDDRHIAFAIALAKKRHGTVDASVFDFLRDVLLMKEPLGGTANAESAETQDEAREAFVMRFQQVTGPIMAKGVEDTAFYRYVRLVALNEVGGDPARFGASVRELHEASQARVRDWPLSLVASSTHDTKRSEDVRARLAVLTERPERWAACVEDWLRLAERHVRVLDGEPTPSATDVYLFLQTAIGAWPFAGIDADRAGYVKRLCAYMEKAAREAKAQSSWLRPNQEYEEALAGLVRGLFADEEFVSGMRALADETATYAATNALAAVALKIVGPGVPDTYQGTELWSFALVDPDNRAEVDFASRRAALRAIREEERDRRGLVAALLERFQDGAIKLYVTRALLRLRRELPALHVRGSYGAIDGGEHVIAFVREHEGKTLACVVPRLPWKLTGGEHRWPMGAAWGSRSLALPARRWTNVLTGEKRAWRGDAPMSEILASCPVAVLLADGAGAAPGDHERGGRHGR